MMSASALAGFIGIILSASEPSTPDDAGGTNDWFIVSSVKVHTFLMEGSTTKDGESAA